MDARSYRFPPVLIPKFFAWKLAVCTAAFISNIEHGVRVPWLLHPKIYVATQFWAKRKNIKEEEQEIIRQVYYCIKIDVIISRVNFIQQITCLCWKRFVFLFLENEFWFHFLSKISNSCESIKETFVEQ